MPDMQTQDADYSKEKLDEPKATESDSNSMPDKSYSAKPKSTEKSAAISGASKALSGVGKSASSTAQKTQAIADKASSEQAPMEQTPKPGALQGATLGSFKKGGTVPQTGIYKLHEGEEVIPAGKRMSLHRHAFNMRKGITEEK